MVSDNIKRRWPIHIKVSEQSAHYPQSKPSLSAQTRNETIGVSDSEHHQLPPFGV